MYSVTLKACLKIRRAALKLNEKGQIEDTTLLITLADEFLNKAEYLVRKSIPKARDCDKKRLKTRASNELLVARRLYSAAKNPEYARALSLNGHTQTAWERTYKAPFQPNPHRCSSVSIGGSPATPLSPSRHL